MFGLFFLWQGHQWRMVQMGKFPSSHKKSFPVSFSCANANLLTGVLQAIRWWGRSLCKLIKFALGLQKSVVGWDFQTSLTERLIGLMLLNLQKSYSTPFLLGLRVRSLSSDRKTDISQLLKPLTPKEAGRNRIHDIPPTSPCRDG